VDKIAPKIGGIKMGFLIRTKTKLTHMLDKYMIKHRRKGEINKFKDKRRVEITESVSLTAEQKRAIDELYKRNYGEKIPYTWHKNFMAHAGRFDHKYFPELLFIPEFERFMNLWPEYARAFSDKNLTPIIAEKVGVLTPKVYISVTKGMIRDSEYNTLTLDEAVEKVGSVGPAFVKPTVDSCSGRGCCVADFSEGIERVSGKAVKEFILSLGEDVVIQERLVCHKSIKDIYPGSVNTFRVITYRWKDEICHMPLIMRIGSGGNFVDNAHAGGMFIAVDDDGQLHEKAMTEFNTQFTEHPDTKVVYKNIKLDLVPEIIAAARKMHGATPQLGVVNWDFTINEDGEPVLIEANIMGGSVWLPQMAHGVGAFGEKTEEVLRWMKFVKKLGVSERKKYAFGKMNEK